MTNGKCPVSVVIKEVMKHKLKFGLVGAGSIAQAYAQAFATSDTARLVAIADVRVDAARALAEGVGCPSYDSYQEMAKAEIELDAVVVCTPPVTHPEISVHFLERKIHVLCEKPLSIDTASARMMLDKAKENSVTLTMATKFRYVEDVVRAKSIVTSGILGEIVLVKAIPCAWNMAGQVVERIGLSLEALGRASVDKQDA